MLINIHNHTNVRQIRHIRLVGFVRIPVGEKTLLPAPGPEPRGGGAYTARVHRANIGPRLPAVKWPINYVHAYAARPKPMSPQGGRSYISRSWGTRGLISDFEKCVVFGVLLLLLPVARIFIKKKKKLSSLFAFALTPSLSITYELSFFLVFFFVRWVTAIVHFQSGRKRAAIGG